MVSAKFALFSAALAATATAYTKPKGFTPCGETCDPITAPATGSTLEVGKESDITWDPTTEGTVTIYLCVGLSNDCENQDVPIADHVANSGTFPWTPTKDLKSTKGQGYGLQIIQDSNSSVFQWSGQFGIDNPSYVASSSASVKPGHSSTATGSVQSYPTSTPAGNATVTTSSYASGATGTGGYNSTVIQPTKSLSVPASLKTSVAPVTTAAGTTPTGTQASASSTPTGAAGKVAVGMGALMLAAFAL